MAVEVVTPPELYAVASDLHRALYIAHWLVFLLGCLLAVNVLLCYCVATRGRIGTASPVPSASSPSTEFTNAGGSRGLSPTPSSVGSFDDIGSFDVSQIDDIAVYQPRRRRAAKGPA